MNNRAMGQAVPLMFVFIFGGIALIATAIIFLFGLQITGEFYSAVLSMIDPLGGTKGEDLSNSIGNGWMMYAVAPPLAVVGGVLFAVLVGGTTELHRHVNRLVVAARLSEPRQSSLRAHCQSLRWLEQLQCETTRRVIA